MLPPPASAMAELPAWAGTFQAACGVTDERGSAERLRTGSIAADRPCGRAPQPMVMAAMPPIAPFASHGDMFVAPMPQSIWQI